MINKMIMSKINLELRYEMKSKPNDEIKVIITLKTGISPKSLHLKNYTVLMENIFSAKLKPVAIEKLSADDNIVSIELDSEMGIL